MLSSEYLEVLLLSKSYYSIKILLSITILLSGTSIRDTPLFSISDQNNIIFSMVLFSNTSMILVSIMQQIQ